MAENTKPSIYWSTKHLPIYNKCVIGLDRDGVINQDIGAYITDSSDFIPIPYSLEAVSLLRSHGHKVVIITNQGGIEKGVMSQQQVDTIHEYMFDLLGQAGCGSIDALYYSVSSRKNDPYAKPNIGMFKRCEKENPHIKFSKGFFVGDKLSDLKAAQKIGATPILVRTGHGHETECILKKFTYRKLNKITRIYDSLWDFAHEISS